MIDKRIAFGLGLTGILLTGFFAFVNLSEWYAVGIMKQVGDYRFGSEGPSPYYYRTPALYAKVNLIWGIIFLTNLIFLIWTVTKDKRVPVMVGFVISLFLLLGVFVHGQVGAE